MKKITQAYDFTKYLLSLREIISLPEIQIEVHGQISQGIFLFLKEETHEGHRDIRPQSQRKDEQKYDKLFLYV